MSRRSREIDHDDVSNGPPPSLALSREDQIEVHDLPLFLFQSNSCYVNSAISNLLRIYSHNCGLLWRSRGVYSREKFVMDREGKSSVGMIESRHLHAQRIEYYRLSAVLESRMPKDSRLEDSFQNDRVMESRSRG